MEKSDVKSASNDQNVSDLDKILHLLKREFKYQSIAENDSDLFESLGGKTY